MSGWNALLRAARAPSALLEQALRDSASQQPRLLQDLLARNSQTVFGRAHGFAAIRSVADYRSAVPAQGYDAFRPLIERMADGENAVLTSAPVIAFEETGGTSSGSKLIPCTAESLLSFRAAILPWLAGLAGRHPAILRGSVYAAISPAARPPRRVKCGIAIGAGSDADYLGADLTAAFVSLLAVPPEAGAIASMDDWRIATLAHLAEREDLAFVSVWSPTFFLDLIEALPRCADTLARRLGPQARARLARALGGGALRTDILWPRLCLISCWAEAGSRGFAARLQAACPGVELEPKGLLATEAAITLPWGGGLGCVPALTSAFIEFMDGAGAPWLAHELREGGSYTVVLTTPGGLYRYAIGDRLRCVSISGGMPRLTFEGRSSLFSDLVGEKIEEAFAARALGEAGPYAALVPRPLPKPHYELWIDTELCAANTGGASLTDPGALAQATDTALRANPQYAYARDLGQLGALACVSKPGFLARRQQASLARGIRLGDIKPLCLLLDADA